MDRQAVFTKVKNHLLKQVEKSGYDVSIYVGGEITDNFICMYEDKHGKRCAIGCLIPKGHPALKLEGDVHTLFMDYPDLLDVLEVDSNDDMSELESDEEILEELQGIHDTFEPKHWERELRKFSEKYQLSWE